MEQVGETAARRGRTPPGSPGGERFTIAEMAAEFGLTHRTIRFYEEAGLLKPLRAGARRLYGKRERVRLALICRGKRLGFTLAEITEFLGLYELGDGRVEQTAFALARIRARIAGLQRQQEDLRQTLAELRRAAYEAEHFLADQGIDPDRALAAARDARA